MQGRHLLHQSWEASGASDQEVEVMENGKPRKRRQLSPEEKWEIFLEVTSQQFTQADCARKWGVDVSTVIRIRRLAKDAALAAFAASKPGRMPSPEQVVLEEALRENDRLSDALKELAIELSLHRGRQRSGFSARSPRA
jgi:transposase